MRSAKYPFKDKRSRTKLAKSIGLEKIPNLDPESFDRLSGILSKKIQIYNFDSV